jgi:hypothetical protein
MRLLLKLAVSVGLLAWLLLRNDLGQVFASIRGVPPAMIAMVAAIIVVEIGIAALRWWLFVPHQSLMRIARLTLIGIFYGVVLPGQVAGEAVKAYRLGAGQPDAEQVAASVFVDKVNGLIGLLILGILGAILSRLDFPKALWMSFSVALALFLVGLYAIRLPALRRSIEAVSGRAGQRWHTWNPLAQRFARFFAAWTRYSVRPGLMLASIALAMLYHLLAIAVIMILAPSFGIEVPLPEWLWIFAVVSLAVLLPLSLGGLGIREGAFVAVLGLLKVPSESALALSLTIFTSQLATALLGGLVETGSALERRRESR